MNDTMWQQIRADIARQAIRYGSCEVKLTYHDGRVDFYEITTRMRRNVRGAGEDAGCGKEAKDGKD